MTRLGGHAQPLRTYPLNKLDGLQWFRPRNPMTIYSCCRLKLLSTRVVFGSVECCVCVPTPGQSMALPPKTPTEPSVERGGHGRPSVVWINSTSRYTPRSELSLGEAPGHYIPGSLRHPPQLYPLVDGTSTPNPLRALRLDEHIKQSLLWSVVGT